MDIVRRLRRRQVYRKLWKCRQRADIDRSSMISIVKYLTDSQLNSLMRVIKRRNGKTRATTEFALYRT